MAKARLPKNIGRYRVTGVVGSGAQGVVLGGFDDALNRGVAIKIVRSDAGSGDVDRLVSEARNVSRLRHPNVVTLLDFGLLGKNPYLVFELLDGVSLREEIRTHQSLGLRRSVILMSQILGGVAAAHHEGLTHRDLSPNNIFIVADNLPKVMDFGLSSVVQPTAQSESTVMGTPRYLYPEPFLELPIGPAADVFSLGSIFYEMLVGQPQFNQMSQGQMFQAIVEGSPRLPSAVVSDIPPVIDEIVQRALCRDPGERFADAGQMKEMLDEYRIPRTQAVDQHSTVDFLLRRLKHSPGFSALANRMQDVLKLTTSDSRGNARAVASLLAKDVTLSQKVLTTANSAMYGGKEVTTLSRAIVTLGLPQVRHCVMNSVLATELSQGSETLHLAQVSAFFSAVLSKEIAAKLRLPQREDAFVCGMFHHLGKMLVMHYFADEYETIRRQTPHRDHEITACREVLGLGFHEIGLQVGRQWKLPTTIVEAMLPLPRGNVAKADSAEALVARIAGLANAIADILADVDADPSADIAKVLQKVKAAVSISQPDVVSLLGTTAASTEKYAAVIGASKVSAPFLARARAVEPRSVDLDATMVLDLAQRAEVTRPAATAPAPANRPSPDARAAPASVANEA